MDSNTACWNFFTNHAHVLFYLKSHPNEPLRKVSLAVGITERAVQRIVAELEEGGYLVRTKVGRQNQYVIEGKGPLRHPLEAHRSVEDLLDWLEEGDPEADVYETYKELENWTIGEHGSEV
jgi:DNA-binding Lrp family transcriptional regulator